MEQLREDRKYTYQDYLQWDDGERWELIDGVPYNMSPAPTFEHQLIVHNLSRVIGNALQGKKCITGITPTDVYLSEHDLVQPDVFVVCDENKIHRDIIRGAPDLIFEVLSPSSMRKDRREKKRLYERFGVREYIMVEPQGKIIERYKRGEDHLFDRGEIFAEEEEFELFSLPGIKIRVPDVFTNTERFDKK
ncbi:MAG: Uma2 family endonuclease [bacterium]|jgi:Uma2 family endonuclease